MPASLINEVDEENVVATEMRGDGGLIQKMAIDMEKTSGFKKYSTRHGWLNMGDEGKGKGKDEVQVSGLSHRVDGDSIINTEELIWAEGQRVLFGHVGYACQISKWKYLGFSCVCGFESEKKCGLKINIRDSPVYVVGGT